MRELPQSRAMLCLAMISRFRSPLTRARIQLSGRLHCFHHWRTQSPRRGFEKESNSRTLWRALDHWNCVRQPRTRFRPPVAQLALSCDGGLSPIVGPHDVTQSPLSLRRTSTPHTHTGGSSSSRAMTSHTHTHTTRSYGWCSSLIAIMTVRSCTTTTRRWWWWWSSALWAR